MQKDDWAVSDVLGNVLLVGITVASFAALTFMVGQIPPPANSVHAEIAMSVHPGPDQSWGTGDEEVAMIHRYGESLPEKGTVLLLAINDGQQRISGSELGFSGGSLDIGERWTKQTLIGFNDRISMDLVIPKGGGNSIMASNTMITGKSNCSTDNDPPHAIIGQTPNNLEATTGAQPFHLTVLLVDICSNVDEFQDPVFEYWFDSEVHASIIMTPLGGDQWEVSLAAPAGDWLNRAESTLQYSITLMADSLGNVGNSPIYTDLVDPLPPDYYYVSDFLSSIGEMTDFSNMQNGTDSGAKAILAEQLPPGDTLITTFQAQYLSTVQPDSNGVWKDAEDVLPEEPNKEATFEENFDPSVNPLRVEMHGPGPGSDRITSLKIVSKAWTDPEKAVDNNDDGWRVQVCWTGTQVTGSSCSQKSGVLHHDPPTGPDIPADITYDITSKRPGGGQWQWDDLPNIDVLIAGQIVGGIRDGDWLVQNVRLVVEHGPGYDMAQEFLWTQPQVAELGDLQLLYYTNAGKFQVDVWDWALNQWNPRAGEPLQAITSTPWSTELSSGEWNNGNPKVRVVSLHTDVGTQGSLYVDYMRLAV